MRCLFRVTFVPVSAAYLAQKDLNALDYLFLQCCNDITQERFAPELQPDVALRLAALHMYQHALANSVAASKLTVKIVELVRCYLNTSSTCDFRRNMLFFLSGANSA